MRALGSWLIALSAAGLLGALLTAITPEKHKKTIRFAAGILVILVVLQPLETLMGQSVTADLQAYEAGIGARLESVQEAAAAEAAAMIRANTEQACAAALAAVGIAAEVSLTPAADGSCFVRAEIVYETPPTDDTIASATEMIAAHTGVAPKDQIHR